LTSRVAFPGSMLVPMLHPYATMRGRIFESFFCGAAI